MDNQVMEKRKTDREAMEESRKVPGVIHVPAAEVPVARMVDVLVLGSGPAEVSVATTAGREGAKTPLVESCGNVGGIATEGLVSHWTGNTEGGIYEEILERSGEGSRAVRDGRNEFSGGSRQAINSEHLETVLLDMLVEAGVDLMLHTMALEPVMDGDTIKGVIVQNKSGREAILTRIVTDATGGGDIAARAGAPFLVGRESDGKMQPATLMFKVADVDVERGVSPGGFEDYAITPVSEISPLQDSEEARQGELFDIQKLGEQALPKSAGHVLLYETTLPGVITYNMTNCIGIGGTKVEDLTKAIYLYRKQMDVIAGFLRNYVPGFEHYYIISSGSLIGVWETRHFKGEQAIMEQDILEVRVFEDWVVARAQFNFGVHNMSGNGLDETGSQKNFYQKKGYTILYGCFVLLKVENPYLAGRNISDTHMAHSNYRVMPICANMGQVADVAVAMCVKDDVTPRVLDAKKVQWRMGELGVGPQSRNRGAETMERWWMITSYNGNLREKAVMKRWIEKDYDLVVVGGGMVGLCGAIAAARRGARTAPVHNRPVLGGNVSSETQMYICGADYHMNRKNTRETGILEEIFLENKRRNPEMTYPIFDTALWEKASFQENLNSHLNTHVTDVTCEEDKIQTIFAEQMAMKKRWKFIGRLFMDFIGDGTLGAMAGTDYELGQEGKDKYGGSLAPEQGDSCTMGSSLMFQARDMGHPVKFVKPLWVNTYTEEQLKLWEHSDVTSDYWWTEPRGGNYRIIEDVEVLRDELLEAVYGMWDHTRNQGDHGAENMELEWVGFLPGKRESRRLAGDYVLTEYNCLGKTDFPDAIAYGGWPVDIHTMEGFLNEDDNPIVWNEANGIYRIPYRCLYSRNIKNLFLGGHAISCSHAAFPSTRVVATCAVAGQTAGTAAALAIQNGCMSAEFTKDIKRLQQELLKDDCHLPGVKNEDESDFARGVEVPASSSIPGYPPKAVIDGAARGAVGRGEEQENCWRVPIAEYPVLELRSHTPIPVTQLRLILDSNLSHEITPSINREVLPCQKLQPLPELIKIHQVDCLLRGISVKHIHQESMGQRLQVLDLEAPALRDTVRIQVDSTYGSGLAGTFEVRIYGSKV